MTTARRAPLLSVRGAALVAVGAVALMVVSALFGALVERSRQHPTRPRVVVVTCASAHGCGPTPHTLTVTDHRPETSTT